MGNASNTAIATTLPVHMEHKSCMPMLVYMSAIQEDYTQIEWVRNLFIFSYAMLFCTGLPLNLLVVKRYITDPDMRQRSGVTFLLNLMLADILLCCTSLWATPYYHFKGQWMFSAWACKALPAIQAISIETVAWSLTVLVLDKCVHITDFTRAPTSTRRAAMISTCIWTTGALTTVPVIYVTRLMSGADFPVTHHAGICGDHCAEQWPNLTAQKAYSLSALLSIVVVPVACITICYAFIFRTINQDLLPEHMSNSIKSTVSTQGSQRRRKAYFMSMGVVGSFLVCWTPLLIRNLALDFGFFPMWLFNYESTLSLSIHLLSMCSVLTNPLFVYWLTNGSKTNNNKEHINLKLSRPASHRQELQPLKPPCYRTHGVSRPRPSALRTERLADSCTALDMSSVMTSLVNSPESDLHTVSRHRVVSYGAIQMKCLRGKLTPDWCPANLSNQRSTSAQDLATSSPSQNYGF